MFGDSQIGSFCELYMWEGRESKRERERERESKRERERERERSNNNIERRPLIVTTGIRLKIIHYKTESTS